MSPTIRRAVIPAAGLGSRLLPLTKAIPKEMLPVGDKPVIEHTVRELVASGITDITIVVSGGKCLIQDHFRPNPAWSTSCARTARPRTRTPSRRSLSWPVRTHHLPRPARPVWQRHAGAERGTLVRRRAGAGAVA